MATRGDDRPYRHMADWDLEAGIEERRRAWFRTQGTAAAEIHRGWHDAFRREAEVRGMKIKPLPAD